MWCQKVSFQSDFPRTCFYKPYHVLSGEAAGDSGLSEIVWLRVGAVVHCDTRRLSDPQCVLHVLADLLDRGPFPEQRQ